MAVVSVTLPPAMVVEDEQEMEKTLSGNVLARLV